MKKQETEFLATMQQDEARYQFKKEKVGKLEQMTFEEIYLIFVNDFLTIEGMAEYYEVHPDLLKHWIDCGRYSNQHAEDWEECQRKIEEIYLNLI